VKSFGSTRSDPFDESAKGGGFSVFSLFSAFFFTRHTKKWRLSTPSFLIFIYILFGSKKCDLQTFHCRFRGLMSIPSSSSSLCSARTLRNASFDGTAAGCRLQLMMAAKEEHRDRKTLRPSNMTSAQRSVASLFVFATALLFLKPCLTSSAPPDALAPNHSYFPPHSPAAHNISNMVLLYADIRSLGSKVNIVPPSLICCD